MAKPIRVCPTFKLYWVDNCKVETIKRYDHNIPFITPEDIFKVIQTVYQNFDYNKHVVKYQDGRDLIDVSKTDSLSFQFNENFTQVSFFIFTSKAEASTFVSRWTPALLSQRFGEVRSGRPNQVQLTDATSLENGDFHESTQNSRSGASNRSASTFVSRWTPALLSQRFGEVRSGRPNQVQLTDATSLENGDFHESTQNSRTGASNKSVHPFVTCDLCGTNVSSSRYKCLECTNYDLCANCERRDLHSDHLMIRVPIDFCLTQGVLYNSTLDGIVSAAQKCIPHTID